MKSKRAGVAVLIGVLSALQLADTRADQHWITITDPDEVRMLVSGRTLDGGSWQEYYRADGKMAYLYLPEDSLVVREWRIDDDGGLCTSVYSRPEYVVDCYTLQRSAAEPVEYRHTHKMGVSKFRFLDAFPKRLSDAIAEKAGAE